MLRSNEEEGGKAVMKFTGRNSRESVGGEHRLHCTYAGCTAKRAFLAGKRNRKRHKEAHHREDPDYRVDEHFQTCHAPCAMCAEGKQIHV